MATTINGTTGKNSSYWKYYLVVTEQNVDISANTSKVKVDVYLGATSYSRAVRGSITATHTITINGTNYSFTTGAYTIEKNTNILLGSVTSNAIAHNDDGSKTISVSASSSDLAQASGYGPYSGSASGQVTLTTIARASSVTCADGNIGSATTININRASSSFTHTLKYAFGTLSGTIVTKTSNTSYGWTIPTSFYAQIPNAKSGQGTITCETYNGSTLIGTKTCSFNAIVLETNNKPTITATVTDTNTTTTALTGDANKLIKYFSNAKVVMTATAKNSSTIKSQKVTCGSKSSTSATATLNAVESGTFNLTCTDSRGFAGSNTVTKTLINYVKLAITSLTIARESSTSNTVKISLKGNYFNSSFGSVANALTLKWRYRLQGGTWSGYTTITATKSGNTFSYSGTLGTNFDYQQAYEFEVVAQDKLITDTKTQPVTKGTPLVDIWKNNVKVDGKFDATSITADGRNVMYGLQSSRQRFTVPGDANTYYPVRFSLKDSKSGFPYSKFTISRAYAWTAPDSWYSSTHKGGLTFSWYWTSDSSWGGNDHTIKVLRFHENYCKMVSGIKPCTAGLIVWLRGGTALYELESEFGYLVDITIHTSSYTDGAGTVFSPISYNASQVLTTIKQAMLVPEVVTLYNNATGTTGTVTLSETSANFTYIEIFYILHTGQYMSTKIYSPNGKNAQLGGIWATNDNVLQANTKLVKISGTSITNVHSGPDWYANIILGNVDSLGVQNKLTIVRVVGYRN